MKKILLVTSLLLAIPFAVNAKTLLPATTLKVNSPDGLTSIKDLSVTLGVYCKYKSGIFFPESKTCGSSSQKLSISSDGVVKIPALETFSGLHGKKIDNYDVSINVTDGDQYLAVLSARGENSIKDLAANVLDLNILRFQAARINVSKDGADFFKSDLAKKENAYLLLSIGSSVKENTINKVLVVSSLNRHLQSLENKNPYQGKILLKDSSDLFVPETALAYLGEEKNVSLNIRLSVSEIKNGTHETSTKAELNIPATNTALSDIGTLELK